AELKSRQDRPLDDPRPTNTQTQPEAVVATVASPPTMEPPTQSEGEAGWSLDDKREVQRALKSLGHLASEPDGNIGPQTRAAMRQFQSFEGYPETGEISDEQRQRLLNKARQLAALIEVTSPSPSGVIAASSKGSAQRLARAAAAESAGKATEAAYWYRLAAVDGEPKALTNLGTLLV